MTYDGRNVNFGTKHVSRQRLQNQLAFRSSEMRLPTYDVEARRTNGPFVGPQTYNTNDSYKRLK